MSVDRYPKVFNCCEYFSKNGILNAVATRSADLQSLSEMSPALVQSQLCTRAFPERCGKKQWTLTTGNYGFC